ncbi:hypothetical protein EG834_22015, partial [bacterium]|nr:hypothetical protein [bacterium]
VILCAPASAYTPAPSPVDGFNPGVDGTIYNVALQPDGQLLVAGTFSYVNGQLHQGTARMKPDGTLDGSFKTFGSGSTKFMALPDGKIVATQIFSDSSGWQHLVRLNSDGTIDTAFTADINEYTNLTLLQPDGKILAVCREIPDSFQYSVVRLNPDGSRDSTFLCNSTAMLGYAALQADGRIIVAGGAGYGAIDGVPFTGIARLNTDGSLDQTFNPGSGTNSIVDWVAVQADGKIVMGGRFTRVRGVNRAYIARLNPNGSLDTSFTPTYNSNVTHLIVQPDGKILTVGKFSTVSGFPRSGMARLNIDGSVDQTFDVGSGISNGTIYNVAMQKDGTILA